MEDKTIGWVVQNQNHPNTQSKYIVASSFRQTRSEAIKAFIEGSGNSWRYWQRNYNFKCVKATCIISTIV
jgi:hypothetical protein